MSLPSLSEREMTLAPEAWLTPLTPKQFSDAEAWLEPLEPKP